MKNQNQQSRMLMILLVILCGAQFVSPNFLTDIVSDIKVKTISYESSNERPLSDHEILHSTDQMHLADCLKLVAYSEN